jgi:putative phage-type endonuclease
MKYIRLRQGSERWRAWCQSGIGSSDAAAILGISPWQTARQLWEVRTRRATPEKPTFAMRRGLRLEPVARRLYEARTGCLMELCCVQHERHDWLRASLDGLDLTGTLVLEIKVPNVDDHRMALAEQVPAYCWPQVQHQLAVTGASRLHYVSYSENRIFAPDERLAVVEVAPDAVYQASLLHAEWCFWGRVLLDYWPDNEAPMKEGQACTQSR